MLIYRTVVSCIRGAILRDPTNLSSGGHDLPRKKDQEARRILLGQAVRSAILERGLEGLRLRDIAEKAGVTPAAVFYYDDVEALAFDTYRLAVERFSRGRELAASTFDDARDRLRVSIDHGIAIGPDDEMIRLLFEFWPRSLREPKVAALDSMLTERQIAVYRAIFVLGADQGHFSLSEPPGVVSSNMVALEDGFQMEVLAGRRTHAEVRSHLHSYVRSATGCDISAE